jgi:hypothetical protein
MNFSGIILKKLGLREGAERNFINAFCNTFSKQGFNYYTVYCLICHKNHLQGLIIDLSCKIKQYLY